MHTVCLLLWRLILKPHPLQKVYNDIHDVRIKLQSSLIVYLAGVCVNCDLWVFTAGIIIHTHTH